MYSSRRIFLTNSDNIWIGFINSTQMEGNNAIYTESRHESEKKDFHPLGWRVYTNSKVLNVWLEVLKNHKQLNYRAHKIIRLHPTLQSMPNSKISSPPCNTWQTDFLNHNAWLSRNLSLNWIPVPTPLEKATLGKIMFNTLGLELCVTSALTEGEFCLDFTQ